MGWIQGKLPTEFQIKNFTSDWNDGRAIGALLNSCAPGLYPNWADSNQINALVHVKKAMMLAEQYLGMAQLIEPHELIDPNVDEQSMMTYLAQYPNAKLKDSMPALAKANSPKVKQKELLNPSKVRVYGPGVQLGVKVHKSTHFIIDCENAQKGVVVLTDTHNQDITLVIDEIKTGTFNVSYTPEAPGAHSILIFLADNEVPIGPFKVIVEPIPTETQITQTRVEETNNSSMFLSKIKKDDTLQTQQIKDVPDKPYGSFRTHGIDGHIFLTAIDDEVLHDISVLSVLHRRLFEKAINELRHKPLMTSASSTDSATSGLPKNLSVMKKELTNVYYNQFHGDFTPLLPVHELTDTTTHKNVSVCQLTNQKHRTIVYRIHN
ncbi:unnamed protein product [Didymodactylos carnosus]|uniref:Calponin-homology (CH) domain-containing protein n=1 Tax=Didymodactylos carnosus TaxID=1234261 RepID=A0A8S2RG21_9BILA|nr:unnamed protein product [Didymodactylos carnosus]CAF4160889.1 unnamed protein product [Didymodactylos carnosus]